MTAKLKPESQKKTISLPGVHRTVMRNSACSVWTSYEVNQHHHSAEIRVSASQCRSASQLISFTLIGYAPQILS